MSFFINIYMENIHSLYYLVLAFFMLRSNLWIFSTFVYTGCKDLIRSLLSSLHCIQSIQSPRFHGHVVCFHCFTWSSHRHCPRAHTFPLLYFCHITGTAGSEDMDVKNFKKHSSTSPDNCHPNSFKSPRVFACSQRCDAETSQLVQQPDN